MQIKRTKITEIFYSKKAAPYIFLMPFIVLFIVFRIWPVIYAVKLSFFEVRGIGRELYIAADNYGKLFQSSEFYKALFNTSYYTAISLLTLVPIPIVLAVLLNSRRTKGKNIYRTSLFLPVLTSLVVVGAVFRIILAEYGGLVNGMLQLFGLPVRKWLTNESFAIPILVVLATWRWTGVNIVYFLSGLVAIPGEVYESASIDGASRSQQFFHITLPLLKPVILFVLVLSIIGGYQLFVEVYTLWNQGTSPRDSALTILLLLYRNAFKYFKMGYASAIGVILTVIIFSLSMIQFRFFGFFRKEPR